LKEAVTLHYSTDIRGIVVMQIMLVTIDANNVALQLSRFRPNVPRVPKDTSILLAYYIATLNIELQCNIYCLFSLSLRFWRVQFTGVMNNKPQTAIKGKMDHAKTSLRTEIFAGARISVIQYLALLWFCVAE
jgi:hypothetical protein